jgi:mycofactocin precursor
VTRTLVGVGASSSGDHRGFGTLRRMDDQATDQADAAEDLVEEELLVEEISIDGMCGVY